MNQRRCEYLLEKEDDLGTYQDMLSEPKEGGFAYSEFTAPKQGPNKGKTLEYSIYIYTQPEFNMSFDEFLEFLKKQLA